MAPAAGEVASFVYFARRSSDGLVKIGRSGNPTARVRHLSRRADPVTLIAAAQESWAMSESYFHIAFQHLRVKGEWFHLDDSQVTAAISGSPDVRAMFDRNAPSAQVRGWGSSDDRLGSLIRVKGVLADTALEHAATLCHDLTQYVNDAVRMRLEADGLWPPKP